MNKILFISRKMVPWISLISVALLSFLLYTADLGRGPFVDHDEATFAEVVRSTTLSGNPFALKFANEPWLDRPPLYFWTVMITEKILHPLSSAKPEDISKIYPTEFGMRFPSAAAGVLCIILVWLIAFKKTSNKKIALIASLILLSTGTFIDSVRQAQLDVPVTAAILFTYYTYLRSNEDRRWVTGFWVGLAAGIMIKGIMGLMVIPIIIIDFLIHNEQRNIRQNFIHLTKGEFAKRGILIAILLVIPWHTYQTILYGPGFWNHYVIVNVFKTFISNIFVHPLNFPDFLGWAIAGALPWNFIFILFIALAYTPSLFTDKSRYRLFLISLISAFSIFITFSLVRTKTSSYLAPMYPFFAITITLGAEAIRNHYFKEHHANHTTTLLSVTACIVFILVAITTSTSVRLKNIEPLQDTYAFAEEERTVGLKIREASATTTVYYSGDETWDTVRFYSAGKKVEVFDRQNTSTAPHYYIVTPRTKLAWTLNTPSIRFGDDFTIEYLGDHLVLIKVRNTLIDHKTDTQALLYYP